MYTLHFCCGQVDPKTKQNYYCEFFFTNVYNLLGNIFYWNTQYSLYSNNLYFIYNLKIMFYSVYWIS